MKNISESATHCLSVFIVHYSVNSKQLWWLGEGETRGCCLNSLWYERLARCVFGRWPTPLPLGHMSRPATRNWCFSAPRQPPVVIITRYCTLHWFTIDHV